MLWSPMSRGQFSLLSPFKLFPSARAPKILRPLLFNSLKGGPRLGQRSRRSKVAHVLFLFRCCVVVFLIFWKIGVCCNEALLN